MDRATVYALALQKLGEHEYKEDSPTHKTCELHFLQALRSACARYNWTFTAREELVPRREIRGGVAYYDIPPGCIKITFFRHKDGRKIKMPRILADGIAIDTSDAPAELLLTYQSDLIAIGGTLPGRNPEFCEGVISLLASKICMPITSNPKLAEALKSEAYSYFQSAIANDRQQDKSNAIDPATRISEQNIFH